MSETSNIYRLGKDAVIFGKAEGGDVVVRVRGSGIPGEHGVEVARISWKHHVDRPTEPLHENVLEHVAGRVAAIIREAREQGYRQAQEDIRIALGMGG